MSTRANIIIRDGSDELWFYRHSDGYPEGALPTLKQFMAMGLRDSVGQAAGWLIVIGHEEYKREPGWKVGSYEPTCGRHGDIEYLYVLDLAAKRIEVSKVHFDSRPDEPVETITVFE